MPSTDSGSSLISSARFLENIGGDPALGLEILALALKDVEEGAECIRSVRIDTDKKSTIRALHSLRGSSAIFEATALTDLLQSMESECTVGGPAALFSFLGPFESQAATYRDGLLSLMQGLRGRQ